MNIIKITRMVKAGNYRLTKHALISSRIRKISIEDIEKILISGEIIERHLDDFEYECYLICGKRFNGDSIHISCKMVDEYLQINTVYFPYDEFWEADGKRRRKR